MIDSLLHRSFVQEHHKEARAFLDTDADSVEISAWCIQCATRGHACSINTGILWSPSVASMYNCTFEYPDLCDFQIIHEPSRTTFNVHLAHIFGKCATVRAQVTSDFAASAKRRITITSEESNCVEAVRTVVFFLYTGFLLDLSVVDIETMTAEQASRVEISYDVYDLYKIASFMMIPSLTDVLVKKGIDVFGPRCDARDCRMQLASLLFRAQGDSVLMDGVIRAIRDVCRSPGILLVYPMMYRRETWDAVMLATKQSFMLCPGVFILYSVIFDLKRSDLVDLINTFRDEMVSARPAKWSMTFREITAGADLRVCLSEECCSGGNIPLLRGPQNFVSWLTDRKDYENLVTHFNLFTLASTIGDKDIATPPWVCDLIERMGELRDTTTMPLLAGKEEIERALRKRHADPVHALLCERLSRRSSQELVLNPEITSIISEGLRLMQTFRDRRMVVCIERKRKAPPKE